MIAPSSFDNRKPITWNWGWNCPYLCCMSINFTPSRHSIKKTCKVCAVMSLSRNGKASNSSRRICATVGITTHLPYSPTILDTEMKGRPVKNWVASCFILFCTYHVDACFYTVLVFVEDIRGWAGMHQSRCWSLSSVGIPWLWTREGISVENTQMKKLEYNCLLVREYTYRPESQIPLGILELPMFEWLEQAFV